MNLSSGWTAASARRWPRMRLLKMSLSTEARGETIFNGRTAPGVGEIPEIAGQRSAVSHQLIADLAAGTIFATAFKAEFRKCEG